MREADAMSLFIKALFVILILGFAGLFVFKKADGTPILSIYELRPKVTSVISNVRQIVGKIKNLKPSAPETIDNNEWGVPQEKKAKSDIYRWKDGNGQWQFSDTPPKNQSAESINVSGDLNKDLVNTYVPPEEPKEVSTTNETSSPGISPMTISPKKLSKLIEDANNIQQLSDERAAKLEKY
ncbi:MAG: hypothetical protein ACJATV_000018 [Granulosicoccus sp.]|jgi:hypothetical protein